MTTPFNDLAFEVHRTAIDKGFWSGQKPLSDASNVDMNQVMAKLALMHSEITEILEAIRKNKGVKNTTEEFADLIIRTLDVWAHLAECGMVSSLDAAVDDKTQINKAREHLHGYSWG